MLGAGHCIMTNFIEYYDDFPYYIDVSNPFDANQYSIYVGAFDISFLNSNENLPLPFPTVKVGVKKVIRVNFYK